MNHLTVCGPFAVSCFAIGIIAMAFVGGTLRKSPSSYGTISRHTETYHRRRVYSCRITYNPYCIPLHTCIYNIFIYIYKYTIVLYTCKLWQSSFCWATYNTQQNTVLFWGSKRWVSSCDLQRPEARPHSQDEAKTQWLLGYDWPKTGKVEVYS